MIKDKKQTHKLSPYTVPATAILFAISFYTGCAIPNFYTEAQIHMLGGILSVIIPISLTLVVFYLISRGKIQNQWYTRALAYALYISVLVPGLFGVSNAIEKLFPSISPWTYYILSTVFLILFFILEVRSHNKKNVNT